MDTTLTIRLSKADRAALRRRAARENCSESALVRAVIQREMAQDGFDYEKVRHLVGSVRLDREQMRDPWAEEIRRNNWRK